MVEFLSSLDKDLVVFDLETTGVDIAKDRIVQISIVKITTDGALDKKNVLINPQTNIPESATEVHGITNEMVSSAPTFKQISKSLHQQIQSCHLLGFNVVRFDVPLLVEEFLRAGIKGFPGKHILILDAFALHRHLNPATLSAVYKLHTGEELENAHDALADSLATLTVFKSQLKQMESGSTKQDIAKVHDICNPGEIVDYARKITVKEGEYVFAFGRHRNKPVHKHLGFCNWILDNDFTMDTKDWVQRIMKGERYES